MDPESATIVDRAEPRERPTGFVRIGIHAYLGALAAVLLVLGVGAGCSSTGPRTAANSVDEASQEHSKGTLDPPCDALVAGDSIVRRGDATGRTLEDTHFLDDLDPARREALDAEFAQVLAKDTGRHSHVIKSRGWNSNSIKACTPELDAGAVPRAIRASQEISSSLIYSYDDDTLSLWLFDGEGLLALHKVEVAQETLVDGIAALRTAIRHSDGTSQGLQRAFKLTPTLESVDTASAAEERLCALTQTVFPKSIAERVPKDGTLLIVPVFNLGTLPFGALQPIADNSYLIDRTALMVAPALGGALVQPVDPRLGGGSDLVDTSNALVVGDPTLDPALELEQLPGARGEARDVAEMLGTEAIIGDWATEEETVGRAPSASMLYFATHGRADPENAMRGSYLALARGGGDGLWSADEIQRLPLRADLAVLSACETGLGQTLEGGVIGLTRAFYTAGVPQVVMSSWRVEDEVTATLMTDFVELLESQQPAAALRAASRKLRSSHPEPSRWAAFNVFGIPQDYAFALRQDAKRATPWRVRVDSSLPGPVRDELESLAERRDWIALSESRADAKVLIDGDSLMLESADASFRLGDVGAFSRAGSGLEKELRGPATRHFLRNVLADDEATLSIRMRTASVAGGECSTRNGSVIESREVRVGQTYALEVLAKRAFEGYLKMVVVTSDGQLQPLRLPVTQKKVALEAGEAWTLPTCFSAQLPAGYDTFFLFAMRKPIDLSSLSPEPDILLRQLYRLQACSGAETSSLVAETNEK
ncbi:MAG: CHAT domain-containing protein [Myxococcota bacterium]